MRKRPLLAIAALFAASAMEPSLAAAHSRRIAHGPTRAELVGVAPPDGVSPRLILRHRTESGAAVEADPVTLQQAGETAALAEHAHGTPILAAGLSIRTELVLDGPAVCAVPKLPQSRYRLRDLANALRHTYTPGERVAVTLLTAGATPARVGPVDDATGLVDWLTTACAAAPPPATPFDADGWRDLKAREDAMVAPNETVVWLLVTAGTAPRLAADDAPRFAEISVALLESFAPETPPAQLSDSATREPGTYQTDPIVERLRSHGVRRDPPAGSGWSPFCEALGRNGGNCLLGAAMSGANAMTMQRLLSEAQALFVTPVSCLPERSGAITLATPTASSTLPAASLRSARCGSWMRPEEDDQGRLRPWMAVTALAAVLAAMLWLRRRRATPTRQSGVTLN